MIKRLSKNKHSLQSIKLIKLIRAHLASTGPHRSSCGWSRTWGWIRRPTATWPPLRWTFTRPFLLTTTAFMPTLLTRSSWPALTTPLWLARSAILPKIMALMARIAAWGSGSGSRHRLKGCPTFGTLCRGLGSFLPGNPPSFCLSRWRLRPPKCWELTGIQQLKFNQISTCLHFQVQQLIVVNILNQLTNVYHMSDVSFSLGWSFCCS